MILQVRKNYQEVIQRTLTNLGLIKTQCWNSLPKGTKHRINLINNDVQLLKDNLTLIINKIMLLESRNEQKQWMMRETQIKYESHYQEIRKDYEKLKQKHQKMQKQLNFIKFTNTNLRKEYRLSENQRNKKEDLQKIVANIEQALSQNCSNLKDKINDILICHHNNQQKEQVEESYHLKLANHVQQKNYQNQLKSIGFVSTERTPIKSQQVGAEQRKQTSSCQLNTEEEDKKIMMIKKSLQMKSSMITDRKRYQLAKLIEQQHKISKIRERQVLSSNLY